MSRLVLFHAIKRVLFDLTKVWNFSLLQSRDRLIPMQLVFARETKEMYRRVVKPFLAFFNGLEDGTSIPARPDLGLPELSNFRRVSCQDMSSFWKTLGYGQGSSSGSKCFCHCCMITGNDRANFKINDARCPGCQTHNRRRCFHTVFCDEEHIDKCKNVMENYVDKSFDIGFAKLDKINDKSEVRSDPNQSEKESDILHIDFEVPDLDEDDLGQAYSRFLTKELKLRLPK